MELLALFLFAIPTLTAITVSSNGNSPEIKMFGGMMVDMQKGFVPLKPDPDESTVKNNIKEVEKQKVNSTKLSINERYRRLIPYMTFYYANDLSTPSTEAYTTKNVEVEKAHIVEAGTIEPPTQRQPKKIVYASQRNIPRYQGNRLTQFNIASANPTKYYYKEIVPVYQNNVKYSQNYNPLLQNTNLGYGDYERYVSKPIPKPSNFQYSPQIRKPYLNLYHDDDTTNVQYYLSEKEQFPRYKLVPYDQTPPVKVVPQSENIYDAPKKPIAVPVYVKEPIYVKPRPFRPHTFYDNSNIQQVSGRKPPAIVSENYYEKRRPQTIPPRPIIEGGFRPIMSPPPTTESPDYSAQLVPESDYPHFESEKQNTLQLIETSPVTPEVDDVQQNYYQYVEERPVPVNRPENSYHPPNTINLGDLLNSLQLNNTIPKTITKENVGASIRTLLQVLNALKAAPQQNEVEVPILSTPKPFIAQKVVVQVTQNPVPEVTSLKPSIDDADLNQEPYLAHVKIPSQHLDDFPSSGSTSQRFPLQIHSDDDGGTPGRPGEDYPVLTTIPHTAFNCKTQRYKGFFADPETRCQVWHYCDLNGGQASFLCPNGTIFSQAALTCDWWFNVRCASTAQLYVLNESLYKYILPHSPKFPEDYSGPLVDKYLSLKFKEMEEQFKKNKNKQSATDKMDSGEKEDSSDESTEKEPESTDDDDKTSSVSEASVIVESSGASGNVQRLSD